MVPLLSFSSPHCISAGIILTESRRILAQTLHHFPKLRQTPWQLHHFTINSLQNDASDSEISSYTKKPQPRTLFPGGYKRPEIKLPNIVLQMNAEEVLGDGSVSDFVDGAVAEWVGIVVVNGGEGGGGELYEAACLLKSVIRDRAYLLVAERVDIASAVNAAGVVLSDQGLPAIVARSTMMGSKSDSVVLPVVGRSVQTVNAALIASKSEGADFLICSSLVGEWSDHLIQIVNKSVKIPIFVEMTSLRNDISFNNVSKLLMSGVSGVVTSLKELKSSGGVLSKILYDASSDDQKIQDAVPNINKLDMLNTPNGFSGGGGIASFVKMNDTEVQFIKKERRLLVESVNAIEKAAPLMEEISLLNDAISQLDEPFLLVIVGEFNTGKTSVINAILGGKFLKEGVVPTTNEITFLRYSEYNSKEQQRCERLPDGHYICYLSAEVLRKMVIVDTPGTNVILQRQQRLTEEFVPRADLLLFVLSADRPLSESEVSFLRYTQQWKKKVVFLLNKADLYENSDELDEAMAFVSENVKKLLNVDNVKLFPVSARSTLKEKLAIADVVTNQLVTSVPETCSTLNRFDEFENFLLELLDGSTSAGLERMKMKLETPIGIAELLLSSCQTLVTQDCRYAKKDLVSVQELMNAVQECALKMETESVPWRRQILSLVESAKGRVLNLVESTIQISNLDLAVSIIFKSNKSPSVLAAQSIQNDLVGPALSEAKMLIQGYTAWLKEKHVSEARRYKDSFQKRWPSLVDSVDQGEFKINYMVMEMDGQSRKAIEKLSASAASKLLDQEIRQVFIGAFGGLGAAGLSASLLTSVLPTTLEDLLALGLCSAGGLLAVSNFPAGRQKVIDKVKGIADAVAQEIEEAMRKDLLAATKSLEGFVALTGKPYEEAAQQKLDKLIDTQQHLADIEKKLGTLRVELQNLHLS